MEGKTWRKKARQEAEEFFNSLPRTGYFVSKKPQTHIYARGAAEGLSSFPKQYANANETI